MLSAYRRSGTVCGFCQQAAPQKGKIMITTVQKFEKCRKMYTEYLCQIQNKLRYFDALQDMYLRLLLLESMITDVKTMLAESMKCKGCNCPPPSFHDASYGLTEMNAVMKQVFDNINRYVDTEIIDSSLENHRMTIREAINFYARQLNKPRDELAVADVEKMYILRRIFLASELFSISRIVRTISRYIEILETDSSIPTLNALVEIRLLNPT